MSTQYLVRSTWSNNLLKDESSESMKPIDEVPLMGLGESEMER